MSSCRVVQVQRAMIGNTKVMNKFWEYIRLYMEGEKKVCVCRLPRRPAFSAELNELRTKSKVSLLLSVYRAVEV